MGIAVLLACVIGFVAGWASRSSALLPSLPPPLTTAAPTDPPVPERPLRFLLIGDSLMGQPAPTVLRELEAAGAEVRIKHVNASGLLRVRYDWLAEARFQIDDFDPDVVVIHFAGAYGAPYAANERRETITPDSDEFFAAWQAAAAELQQVFLDSGARVYWLSSPPLRNADTNIGAQRPIRVNLGYQRLAAEIPGVEYLDTGQVLAGLDGTFLEFLTPPCGNEPVRARSADGVHLDENGAAVLGAEIAHALGTAEGLPTRDPSACEAR